MIDWIKSHLVDDAGKAWKWASVRVLGVIVVIGPAWLAMPDDLKSHLPSNILPYISALAFFGLLMRVKK